MADAPARLRPSVLRRKRAVKEERLRGLHVDSHPAFGVNQLALKWEERKSMKNSHSGTTTISLISDAVLEFASLLHWRIQDTERLSNMQEELLTPPGASMALLMLSSWFRDPWTLSSPRELHPFLIWKRIF